VPVPRVLVSAVDPSASRVTLASDDAHHLARVLRVRTGDEVRVFDGRGREWLGRLADLTRGSASVELVREIAPAREPAVRITLAIALLKHDQMDAVVRDATMLGAAAIAPMTTDHVTVPGRAWKSGAALDRWHRVAIASAKQCGRATVPEIHSVRAFADVVRAASTGMLICLEPSARVDPGDFPETPVDCLLLVGPEGGWSAVEVSAAIAAGAHPLRLGPRTLRAESVPTVALSSLWTQWGW